MPFELHADTPVEGAPKPFPPEQVDAYRARMRSMADNVGLPIDPPTRNQNSRLALETGELIRALAGDDAANGFHHAASRAFFADRANIADFDTIAALAQPFGVTREAVEEAWRTHRYGEAVDASLDQAMRSRVTGVPAFAWPGGRALTGMRPADDLVEQLGAMRPRTG